MEPDCHCFEKTFRELDELAPGIPLLALGQTVFWDEPMKAGVAQALRKLGSDRRFVAGVHDTDYFAKFASGSGKEGFRALPHNDTTTKNLWSAAGEFSCLFGSETVVTRDALQAAGGKVGKVESERPGFLDEITEAWGWRGVVSLSKESKITYEKRLSRIFPELYDTLDWAIRESLDLVSGPHREDSGRAAHHLLAKICDEAEAVETDSLAAFYRRLIPKLFNFVAGEKLDIEATQTTELLAFNPESAGLPRFEILGRFLNRETRMLAESAYNDALKGSEIYTLERFGAGALPFDVFLPGHGRGTLRLGTRGGLVMCPDPVGFSYKKRPETPEELAQILQEKFGDGVVLVGKAVSLILMLAREFVFVFHEGASGYVWRSAAIARTLSEAGHGLALHPILRIKYEPWDAMGDCCAWLKLPEPLQRPFGTMELSAPSFAVRWREVAAQQKQRLKVLATLKRPLQLLQNLQETMGGPWSCLATEYESMQKDVEDVSAELRKVKEKKAVVLQAIRTSKAEKNGLFHRKGEHWRARIFEKDPTDQDWADRREIDAEIEHCDSEIRAGWLSFRVLDDAQKELVGSERMRRIRERRKDIALEAEMVRLRLIREAIVATDGLEHAGHRPAAWWFPLVCPEGSWFRATMAGAEYRLEMLS